jgi:hypothetical protein
MVAVLVAGTCLAGWQEDWELDRELGLDKRPFRVLFGGVRRDGQGTPLMKAGLPPYDQQPDKAQEVPEPEVVDVPDRDDDKDDEPKQDPTGARGPNNPAGGP